MSSNRKGSITLLHNTTTSLPKIRIVGCSGEEVTSPTSPKQTQSSTHSISKSLPKVSLHARATSFLAKTIPRHAKTIPYHAKTIWLFASNDIKAIVLPSTLFSIAAACSTSAFGVSDITTWHNIRPRTPLVMIWLFVLLLIFNIQNQTAPGSVEEDAINKPWRPIPQRRITSEQAQKFLLFLYPLTIFLSLAMGGLIPCIGLLVFFHLYNKRGAHEHPIWKNVFNGLGFSFFNFGALEVLLGQQLEWQSKFGRWIVIICLVVATTVHSQDIDDQEGDRMRERRTIPLVIGDNVARWSLAVPIFAWSVACPWFWQSNFFGYFASLALAFTVVLRTLTMRKVAADKKTAKVWNAWIAMLYLLPLFRL